MGVGHVALALGASGAAKRVNVGWLVFAALLADFLLGVFAKLGLEQAHVPADYGSRHYLTFTFPYSHGLIMLVLWGLLLGSLISNFQEVERVRVFFVVAMLVVSHFLLDGLVHVVGLPIAGEGSVKFGLGLWNHLQYELSLETVMALFGFLLYLRVAKRSPLWCRFGILFTVGLIAVATWAQLFVNEPPLPSQLIFGWIIGPVLFGAVFYALDRKRQQSALMGTS